MKDCDTDLDSRHKDVLETLYIVCWWDYVHASRFPPSGKQELVRWYLLIEVGLV